MEAILFFILNLMMVVKRDMAKQTDKGKPACLGIVYSFEAYLIEKQSLSVLPDMPKNNETLQPFIPIQKSPNRNPRTEWQIWCENNRMLFQNSA
ncbi:hypothetical protein [Paenibacillus sp. Soil522]|uniref:hypothetical protein n=1 Tax=Paenibacillus sp. Soil522 TaxID=1736388 RepID=UPI0006FC820A|nr:hypothetical protein [Paenibacillus sp. Soil522]KRE53559.1 hypothetical protein ASG81_02000 [Paenibacillus sp. Soil522]